MTPPTRLRILLCWIGCEMLDVTTYNPAHVSLGYGGVMTPPYESININKLYHPGESISSPGGKITDVYRLYLVSRREQAYNENTL